MAWNRGTWRALFPWTFALVGVANLGCDGRRSSPSATLALTNGQASSPQGGAGATASGPALAMVDLSGGVPEQEAPSFFGSAMGVGGAQSQSFDALVQVLESLAVDSRTAGVFVRFGGAVLGAARAQELGDRLHAVRAKKPVVCHSDGFSNATLMAASRGCSQIFVSPAGGVEAVGLAAQVLYMRRLLADQLHLSIDMLQVGKFKGAEEPLTRDGPSPEARASLTDVLGSLRTAWLEAVVQGRSSRPEPRAGGAGGASGGAAELRAALEDGPYAPVRATELGLIDAVGYAADALEALKKSANVRRERLVFGPGAEEPSPGLEQVVRLLAGTDSDDGPVALLRLTGSIAMTSGGNGLLGGRSGIHEKELDRTLREIEKDDAVKAVVMRIDSPGGSALASDLIWHHLMALRKKKPLVVSVGDMAASGGMYLASAGDYIFAEPMSIVGSIGVVGGKISGGEALEQVGVHVETFAANTERQGAAVRATYESPFVRWDDATRIRVRESMNGVYELFLSRVAEGRSTRGRVMPRERVAESAEGKIFAGREAQARGLIDALGGLSDAIAKARVLANLDADAHVAVVGGKSTFLDALLPGGAGAAEEHLGAATAATPMAILARVAPTMVPFVSSLAPLAEGEHTVVALPFSMAVR